MLLKDMDPELKITCSVGIARHSETLRTIYLGCAERLIKALFFVNSGGLIAILTYMYKDTTTIRAKNFFHISFGWFLAGFIVAFVLVICDYLVARSMMNNYHQEIGQFREQELDFEKIKAFSTTQGWCKKIDWAFMIIGALSIGFTGMGIFYGYLGFVA